MVCLRIIDLKMNGFNAFKAIAGEKSNNIIVFDNTIP